MLSLWLVTRLSIGSRERGSTGVQIPTTFTPLPSSTQRLLTGSIPGSRSRLPAW